MILNMKSQYGTAAVDTQGAQLMSFCNADGLGLEFPGDVGVRLVHTRVGGQRVLLCHLPEGVFDDDRGIPAHPQF